MIATATRSAAALAALAASLAWASAGFAQDQPKDKEDAVESLLQKLDDRTADDPAPARADDKKADAPAEKKAEPAELDTKDKALDSLLEKLGETDDAPDTTGKAAPKADAPDEPKPQDQAKPDPSQLKGKEKDLDEHLEELTGRKKKKKDQDEERDGKPGSPLTDVVKQMRDVEERLNKPDTGDDTRQRQEQIVKKLDTLIDQLRSVQGQTKVVKVRKNQQAGQKNGNQQGAQQGAQAKNNDGKGTGASKPSRPTDKHSTASSKDVWGHLDPQLREEMENVFKEEALPRKAERIKKYYLSVSKKGQARGE